MSTTQTAHEPATAPRTARCGHPYAGAATGAPRARCGPSCTAPVAPSRIGRPRGWRPSDHGVAPGGRPPKDGVAAGAREALRLDQATAQRVQDAGRPGETRSATVVRLLEMGAQLRAERPGDACDPGALPTGPRWSAVSRESVRLTSALTATVTAMADGGATRSQCLRALLADGLDGSSGYRPGERRAAGRREIMIG